MNTNQSAVHRIQETGKVNLLGLPLPKLEAFFESLGEKPFRAVQVLKWMHQGRVDSFDEMTNLSKALRARLNEVADIVQPSIRQQSRSRDGTLKWVVEVAGGNSVEMVLIPDGERRTLCVSSQVGCSLDCSFCSTGKQGFNRNLSAAEIVGQLRIASQAAGGTDSDTSQRAVTNVVLMGMGEPLMNFEPVVDAMELMMEDNAYGLSKRRVTLSTAGLVPGIDKLAKTTDVSLALSLHAPNNALRDELVPINRRYPLEDLLAAARRYLHACDDKRVITVEYTLIDGVNDRVEHARELAMVLRELPCKLNLIPFNPFPGSGYRRSQPAAIEAFQQVLQKSGYTTTVRSPRGDDIGAACGQLVGQVKDRTRRSRKYIHLQQAL